MSDSSIEFIAPPGWPVPRGYENGALVRGPTLFVAGQVGWTAAQVFESDDLATQFAQALDNVLAVVRAAGGGPEHVAKMTIYVTDLDAYRKSTRAIGAAWRARFGKHFPAMALVGVAGLVEPRAKVEIETIAAIPPSVTEGAEVRDTQRDTQPGMRAEFATIPDIQIPDTQDQGPR